jgi:hypothetical protein
MLNQSELTTLHQIVSDDTKTFESIAQLFQEKFEKFEQFKVGLSLWIMIKQNLLSLSQRLASFYIIYDMYKQEDSKTTPFIPLFLECLEKSTINIEKKMLKDLIEFNSFSTKITVREFIENGKNMDNINIPENDLKQYWRMHESHKDKCIQENTDFISPVLYDNTDLDIDNNLDNKDIINNDVTQNVQNQENMPIFDISKMSPEELNFDSIEPNFLTYYPNSNNQFFQDEPMWILPTLKYDFIWDFTMAPVQDTLSNLLNKPLKNKTLNEEQFNFIIETIEENPNILKEIGFKPDNLFELIEKNENLATEILYKVANHVGFEGYLNLFLEKKWTINLLKVVNKLIQKIDFPRQFITTFLKHMITCYENEQKKESKVRLSKLISFFLLNLLDHEHITTDMIPESITTLISENIKEHDIQKLNDKLLNKELSK